jgi:Tetratricopeptide repeat
MLPMELLQAGETSLKEKRYPDAVDALEAFCEQAAPDDNPDYAQAQVLLARAYKGNGQVQDAIDLGQLLSHHPDSMIQSWAVQFLAGLGALQPIVVQQSEPVLANDPPAEDLDRHIQLQSLDSLRSFYKKNLVPALEQYESKRRETALKLLMATISFVLLLSLLAYFSPPIFRVASSVATRRVRIQVGGA